MITDEHFYTRNNPGNPTSKRGRGAARDMNEIAFAQQTMGEQSKGRSGSGRKKNPAAVALGRFGGLKGARRDRKS